MKQKKKKKRQHINDCTQTQKARERKRNGSGCFSWRVHLLVQSESAGAQAQFLPASWAATSLGAPETAGYRILPPVLSKLRGLV